MSWLQIATVLLGVTIAATVVAGVARSQQWSTVGLLTHYMATISGGILLGHILAGIIGIWLPRLRLAVLLSFSGWWIWNGFKHAIMMDHQRTRRSHTHDPA